MSYLPAVTDAEYVSGYVIRLTFDNGVQKSVDFSQWFKGPVFEPLKNIPTFQKFFIEAGAIAWPVGVDVDPEALYGAEDVEKAA